ncbi:MAG: hypothetical protein ING59_17545 [Burkholderiales bacterium]|nr:hypothetical protein [Burkholderiales bacterium]
MAELERVYRLGLAGFSEAQTAELMSALARLHDVAARWRIVEHLPFDALLLARGSRSGDPDDVAVLRLLGAAPGPPGERRAGHGGGALQLRKPIADEMLRSVLLAARDRLRAGA